MAAMMMFRVWFFALLINIVYLISGPTLYASSFSLARVTTAWAEPPRAVKADQLVMCERVVPSALISQILGLPATIL